MNFDLGEDQAMLKETLNRLLADRYGFETRRALARDPRGWSRDLWTQLAELGVLAATFAEEDGGLGGGPEDAMVIGEALGAALSAEPYLATVVMGGTALRLGSDRDAASQLLPAIAGGEAIVACALDFAAVTAREAAGGWVLEGTATNVIHGGAASSLVVAATGEAGEALVLLADAAQPGVSVRPHRTFDGLVAAEITFDAAPVQAVLARGNAAQALVERVVEHAIAYLAAEATGLMAMLLDITIEHLKTRSQFGQVLARFQALQHRASEMLVSLEQSRSMAIYAAMMTDDPDSLARAKAFHAIKAVISTAARFVGQNAVQLHGGIGLTEEHRAGWGLRRLTMIEMLFGDADAQAARLAELGGLVEPA